MLRCWFPIQVGMLAGISASFGVELSKALFRTLVASMVGAGAATFAGRAIVSNLAKLSDDAGGGPLLPDAIASEFKRSLAR